MKKRNLIVCIMLLCCLIISQPASPASGSRGPLVGYVSVRAGFDSVAVSNHFFPIRVTVTGDYLQAGNVVEVAVPSSANAYYYYRKPLDSAKTMQMVDFCVDITAGAESIVVNILDEEGRSIYKRFVQFENLAYTATVGVGVLTGNYGAFDFINGTYQDENTSLSLRTLSLKAAEIPEDAGLLRSLPIILAEDYDFSRFTDGQIAAIREWIRQGGILLYGPGNTGNLLPDQVITDGTEAILNHAAVFTTYAYKEGKIIVCNTSYTMMGSADEQEDIANALKTIIGESLEPMADWLSLDEGTIEIVQDMDRQSGNTKPPQLYPYVLLMFVYVLLVIPGVYLLLRSMGKLKLLRIVIAGAAVLFALFVVYMGRATRHVSPFIHYIGVEQYTGGLLKEKVYFGIQAPFNRDYDIAIKDEYALGLVQDITYWSGADDNDDSATPYLAIIKEEKDVTNIAFVNHVAFEEKYFTLSTEQEAEGGILSNLRSFDGIISGTIKNQTDSDLKDVVLFLPDQILRIGRIKAGEEKAIDSRDSAIERIEYASLYARARYFGQNESVGYHSNYIRALCQQYVDGNGGGCVIAVKENGTTFQKTDAEEKGYEQYGITLVAAALQVDHTMGDKVYFPNLFAMGNTADGSAVSEVLMYDESMIVSCKIPDDFDMIRMNIRISDYSLGGYPAVSDILLYDWERGVYQSILTGELQLLEAELVSYIEDGKIYIKLIGSAHQANLLPSITFVGREKHADD